MLDSVRSYASTLLLKSNKSAFQNIGKQLSPGVGPLNLTFGPQWASNLIQNGVILPANQLRFKPFWFIGASYGF